MVNKNGSPGDKNVTQLQVYHRLFFWPDTFHHITIHICRNQHQTTINQSENTKIKNICDTNDHKMCDIKKSYQKMVDKIKGTIFHLHRGGK
jgi:hypothetical protein